MDNPTPPRRTAPRARRHMAGFGIVQAAIALMLVAGVLGAGALVLQAKRAPAQASGQEQALRWADEAIAAFASAHARLPCPASTVHGVEDCSGARAQGWLPLRSLAGASGIAPQIGPMAYMVYRGDATAHLDLTAPGNAWRPRLTDGNNRRIAFTDDGGAASHRDFDSINSLDLCRALELAEAAAPDAARARVARPDGTPLNVAYGIAAAGPMADATSRLDAVNAGVDASMAAPGQAWDAGYDDRVRVRSFDRVAHTLGCRLLAGSGAPASAARAFAGIPFLDAAATPPAWNVQHASMDALAAAVTLHDSLKALQDANVKTTNDAVLGAAMAQAGEVIKVVMAAASVSGAVTSLSNNAASLSRAVATCIASLGVMCWEVPLKATAVGLSVASVVTSAVALGLNIAAIPPTALALAKTVEARDRAKNAARERPRDLKATIDDMACQLYGRDPPEPPVGDTPYNPCTAENDIRTDAEGKPVLKRDAYGSPIPVVDGTGRQVFDGDGTPLYQYEYVVNSDPKGLDDERDDARRDWQDLLTQVTLLDTHRLGPWDDANIRHRIHEGDSLNLHGGRYKRIVCDYVGQGNGDYDGACNSVPRDDGKMQGTHANRREVFLWDVAIGDAIRQRTLAEAWARTNLREKEVAHEVEELQKNFDMWFTGSNGQKSLLQNMIDEREDAQHCGASPVTDLSRQKCTNARIAVEYVHTCRREVRNDVTGDITVEEDMDPFANCRGRLADRLEGAKRDQREVGSNLVGIQTAYANQTGPSVRYPAGWFEHALEEVETDGRKRYEWRHSPREMVRNLVPYVVPYYAPEPWNTGTGWAPILVWTELQLEHKDLCEFFQHVIFGDKAFRDGLYCQRYPYNRAYSDRLLADKAAGEAKNIYDALVAQFENLETQYDDLRRAQQDEAGDVNARRIGFGAESALERADVRGSVGPQPVTTP